jgi:hypothetical protein
MLTPQKSKVKQSAGGSAKKRKESAVVWNFPDAGDIKAGSRFAFVAAGAKSGQHFVQIFPEEGIGIAERPGGVGSLPLFRVFGRPNPDTERRGSASMWFGHETALPALPKTPPNKV